MIKNIVTTAFLCLCVIAGAAPELIFQSDFTKVAPPFMVWGKLKDGMLSANGRYDFGGIILDPSEQALTIRCTLKCDPGTSLGILLYNVKNNSPGEKLCTVVWDAVKPETEQTFSWKLDASFLKEKSFLIFFCINPQKGDLTVKEIQIEKIPDPQPRFGTQSLVYQSDFMENKPPFNVWGKLQSGMLISNGRYDFGGIILPPSKQALSVSCTLKCDPGTFFGLILFKVKNNKGPGQRLDTVSWGEIKTAVFQTHTWKINPVYLKEESFLILYCINPKYGNLTVKDIRIERVAETLEIPLLEKKTNLNDRFDSQEADAMLHLVDFLKFPVEGNKLVADETEVFLGITPQTLYGVVILHHPRLDKLKSGVYPRDDSRVFKDDSIEFFISAPGHVQPYYQFAFNAAGSLYDAMGVMKNWDSGFRSSSQSLGKHCTAIRFELPLKDIGYTEVDHNVLPANWGINFCRNHSTGGSSTWGRIGSTFHDPAHFNRFKGFGIIPGIVAASAHFSDTEAVQELDEGAFWKNEKTLYSELFTDQDSPLKGHGAYIWLTPLDSMNNTLFGLQYGAEYSKAEMLEELRKHNIHPFCRYGDVPHYADWAKKTGIGLAVYFRYYRNDSFAWDLSDDATMKRKLDELDALLTKYEGTIWGVSLGDEALEILLGEELIRLAAKPGGDSNPEILRVRELIRNQYGFGKYDLPKSFDSQDQPFHQLATRRFILSKLQQMQKGILEICQKHRGPDGKKVISISPTQRADNILTQQSRFADGCDLFTAQIVPSGNPWRQTVAFYTKLIRDLTGKPVFPCAHIENYHHSNDSETTAAYMSEILRGGGSGMQLYLHNVVEHYNKMGGGRFCYYGHRPRWNTIMEQVDRFCTMKQLRFPKPEYAMFLSDDSALAIANFPDSRCEWLFNLVGPGAGSSFQFISDTQLIDGKIRLKDFPFVLLPAAPIQSKAVQQKFEEYVQNGGMLVCFDPHVFDRADDGSSTGEFRERLFGVKTFPHPGGKELRVNGYAGALPLIGQKFSLKPEDGTTVVGKTGNDPLITVKNYSGGGKAVMFSIGSEFYYAGQKVWVDYAKQELKKLGASTDQDIWKFTLPFKKETRPVFEGLCLSGNNAYWYRDKLTPAANRVPPGACYRFTLPPDGGGNTNFIFFGKGNLMNRLEAPTAGDIFNPLNAELVKSGKLRLDMFADTWTKTDAFEIQFELGKNMEVTKLKIFWNGELPNLTLQFDDGTSILFNGEKSEGVGEKILQFASKNTAKITLGLARRAQGGKLTISEVEIWSSEKMK